MTLLAKQEFSGDLKSQIFNIYEFIESTRQLNPNQRLQCTLDFSPQYADQDKDEIANWLAARNIETKAFVNHQAVQHFVTLAVVPPKQSLWSKMFGSKSSVKPKPHFEDEQPPKQDALKEEATLPHTSTQRTTETPKNETRKPVEKSVIEPDIDSPYPDVERLLLAKLSALVEQVSYQNKMLRQERQHQMLEIKQISFKWIDAAKVDPALNRQLNNFLTNSQLYPVRRALIRGLLRKVSPACIEYFVLDQIELLAVEVIQKKATIEQIDLTASDELVQPALQVHIETETYLEENSVVKDNPQPKKELIIKVSDDSNNPWEHVAISKDFKIGREGDVTLTVSQSTAPKVSREHLRCFLQNDTWYLQNISVNKKATSSKERRGNPILIDGMRVLDTGEKQAVVHGMSVRVGTAEAIAVGEYAIYPELIFEFPSDLFNIEGTDFLDAQQAPHKPKSGSSAEGQVASIIQSEMLNSSTNLMIEPTEAEAPVVPANPPICYICHDSAHVVTRTPVYQLPLLMGRHPDAESEYIVPANFTKVSRQHVELQKITDDGIQILLLEKAANPVYIGILEQSVELKTLTQGQSSVALFEQKISLAAPSVEGHFVFWVSRHAN